MSGAVQSSTIGLLGGSFNPAHEGHREISLAALSWLNLDAVWWLVSPGNPLKDENDYAPYHERLAKARTVANHHSIVVSNFEERRGLQYTVDTLDALIDRDPQTQFIWLMGADSFAGFHRWKEWRRVATLVPFAIFNRPGHQTDALNSIASEKFAAFRIDPSDGTDITRAEPPAWSFFEHTDSSLSSTEIRNRTTRKDLSSSD